MSKYAGKLITNQAPAGYSVFFDGSGDYLTVPAGSAFAPGTGNFTIEAWVYPTASGNRFIWTQTVSGTNYFVFAIDTTAYLTMTASGGGTGIIGPANSIKQNAWNHIAAVRVSGTVTVYVNGVGGTPTSNTLDLSNTTYTPTIGTYTHSTASDVFTGYVSNLRYVKGTALYTANFTPPTQLFNVTNTSLLTCNSPTLIDQSSNAFAITANGNAAVSTFTPFTAYVPYNPALGASTPGVWTLDEAMQAAATRQWNMYDPSFQNTTLLLHGNGTNAAQNNTFLDSSSNNFSITRNPSTGPNAPTQGTFSPFSQTGWGNYLNGSTDYFRVSDNAVFDFSTGAFCIEMWFMLTADAAQNGETNREANLLAAFPDSGALATTYTIGIGGNSATTGTAIAFSIRQSDTIAYNQIYTATITKNVWHHIAVCRSGNDFAMFYDGLRVSSNSSYTYTVNTNHSVKIGALIYPTYNHYFPGYISNLRIVKGASVYAPTSLNIAVPTEPLGTTSGGQTPPTGTQTSLLTCQSNRFVDNSSNAFAITVNGTPSVQAFSPFYPTAAYTPATRGGGGYFDGTGDYLVTSTTSAAFAYGTGDFTYSAWIYPLNVSGTKVIIDGRRSADKVGPVLYLDNATLTGAKNETTNVLAGGTVTANAWNFVELTRTSSNWRLFVNGSLTAGPTADAINYSANQLATVGANGMDASQGFAGYIADARVLKGTGGTSSTMPTLPLTNITNTSLLLNFTNAGIVDSTAKNVLETVGNAQISTAQSKFGGSSMSFDGSGDYIVEPTNLNFGYGTGDFTIEFWLRLNSTATQTVVSNLTSASSVNPHLYILSGGSIRYYTANADRITGSTLSANQWYHVALCRSGTSTRLFIDGTQSGSTYTDSNNYGTTAPLGIGTYWASGAPVTADTLNGYIDDLRITKGFARYTGNFTPQTSQWQDQ